MMERDFKRARWQLIFLYLVIIGSVIVLFSLLTMRAAKDALDISFIPKGSQVVMNEDEARAIAQLFKPGIPIKTQEYELEGNGLLLSFVFEDGEEVKANLFNRNVYVEDDEHESVLASFAQDFDDHIITTGLLVFLLASFGSVYVAHRTLRPIIVNIRRQRQFVSGAAHELRNPLAAIHARIESALREPSVASPRDLLEDLLVETKRLIAMSENLLDIERIRHTKAKMEVSPIGPSVADVVDRLAASAASKSVHVTVDVGESSVRMSKVDLETVLHNLLHNAIKFSRTGGHVTVRAKNGRISVRDEGIGIDPLELPHIFEPFYKVESARAEEGSGLGLALVSDTVTQYGGTLQVKSELGKGTEISIIL